MSRKYRFILGGALALLVASYMAFAMVKGDKRIFLPGKTSAGHYQIAEDCGACHVKPFASAQDMDRACKKCHGTALDDASDSHPERLFNDPRNQRELAVVDARSCVACHREHRPGLTGSTGETMAQDSCAHCHADIAMEHPTHKGLAPTSCTNGGCHNYHDNTAMYYDFQVKHLREPEITKHPVVKVRKQLFTSDAQHMSVVDVDIKTCNTCHDRETGEFGKSREGMRVAQALTPMKVGDARLPMQAGAHDSNVTCTSCHSLSTKGRSSDVEACLSCHDDAHSKAYKASGHFALWQREVAGRGKPGSGVSCATCHMPVSPGYGGLAANHNVNNNLRPPEKMIRGVCMNCHGYAFSLDAMADKSLVDKNFDKKPSTHVHSLEMVAARKRSTHQ